MKAKNAALYGLLTALALVLSYLESLAPLSIAVPGIKMGLPNIVVVFALYKMSFKDACCISLVRVLLVSILFGNLFVLIYSAAGAVLSLIIMQLLTKTGKFGITGVSVAGGVAHNIGQIIVAMLVLETSRLVYYLPVLLVSGTVAGICIGIASAAVCKRIKLK